MEPNPNVFGMALTDVRPPTLTAPGILPTYDELALAIRAYARLYRQGIWRPADMDAFDEAQRTMLDLDARLARVTGNG